MDTVDELRVAVAASGADGPDSTEHNATVAGHRQVSGSKARFQDCDAGRFTVGIRRVGQCSRQR